MRRGARRRVKPLLPIFGMWMQGYKYPTWLKVPMMDGHVQKYVREMEIIPLHVGWKGWVKSRYEMTGYQFQYKK